MPWTWRAGRRGRSFGCAAACIWKSIVNELARVESEQHGSVCLVRIFGEIDMSNDRDVLSEIEVAVGRETDRLVVDLTHTTYLDSAVLALLLRLAERMQARRQMLIGVVS